MKWLINEDLVPVLSIPPGKSAKCKKKKKKKKKNPSCLLGLGDLFPNGKEVMLSFVKCLSSLLMIISTSGGEVRPINLIYKQCEPTVKLYASLEMPLFI